MSIGKMENCETISAKYVRFSSQTYEFTGKNLGQNVTNNYEHEIDTMRKKL